MRLIDADAFYKDICDSLNEMTRIGIAVDGEWLWGKLNDSLDNAPTIEPEPQIIYSKAGYIMSLHKEYGCTLIRAEEAHNKALEYLRDKAMMKG